MRNGDENHISKEKIKNLRKKRRLQIYVTLGIMTFIGFLYLGFITFTTDSYRSKLSSIGNQQKIEILGCDGSTVRTYVSTGKVEAESASDGYYFKDSKTGNNVRVSGNLIITEN